MQIGICYSEVLPKVHHFHRLSLAFYIFIVTNFARTNTHDFNMDNIYSKILKLIYNLVFSRNFVGYRNMRNWMSRNVRNEKERKKYLTKMRVWSALNYVEESRRAKAMKNECWFSKSADLLDSGAMALSFSYSFSRCHSYAP